MATETQFVIIPFSDQYRDRAERMMEEINREFALPPHHPDYVPTVPDHYWLALSGTDVIGSVALIARGEYGVLKRMFVKTPYRGPHTRIAARLLDTAIAQCNTEGLARLCLGTLSVLKAAQRFYEKTGFQRIAQHELPEDFPHNLSDDCFYIIELGKTLTQHSVHYS